MRKRPVSVRFMENTESAEDGEESDAGVSEDSEPHIGKTKEASNENDNFNSDSKDKVLVNNVFCKISKREKVGEFGEIIIHDDDVGGFNGGFGASCSHGNTDIGATKSGRIVNAVTDKNCWCGFGDSFKAVELVSRQHFGVNMVDAELVPYGLSDGVFVAGKHIGREAMLFEKTNCFDGGGLKLVGDSDRGDVLVINVDMEQGVFLAWAEQGVADGDSLVFDGVGDSLSGGFMKVLNFWQL